MDQRAAAAPFGAAAVTTAGLRRTPRFHGIATVSVALVAITDASQRRFFCIASFLQSPAQPAIKLHCQCGRVLFVFSERKQ
jgi:hypothetical protein